MKSSIPISDFSALSNAIMNVSDGIKCTVSHNNDCICCNKVELEMVSVGAYIMCNECFAKEFSSNIIMKNSSDYENYKKWLKIYQTK